MANKRVKKKVEAPKQKEFTFEIVENGYFFELHKISNKGVIQKILIEFTNNRSEFELKCAKLMK